MACWETLLVDGVDIQNYAGITSADGLLSDGPTKGDVIEQDWVAGAIWQQGSNGVYSFEVPVVMNSKKYDVALGQLRAIQAWRGSQHTLTRRLTVNGVQIQETCQAVMAGATQVRWDFRKPEQVTAILVWQNLSGVWS